MDGENRPTGLITERDMVRRVLVKEADCRQDLSAREAMNPKLNKARPKGSQPNHF